MGVGMMGKWEANLPRSDNEDAIVIILQEWRGGFNSAVELLVETRAAHIIHPTNHQQVKMDAEMRPCSFP